MTQSDELITRVRAISKTISNFSMSENLFCYRTPLVRVTYVITYRYLLNGAQIGC